MFPKQELIRLLEGLSPDDVERVFKDCSGSTTPRRRRQRSPEDVEELVTDVVMARDVLLEELGTTGRASRLSGWRPGLSSVRAGWASRGAGSSRWG